MAFLTNLMNHSWFKINNNLKTNLDVMIELESFTSTNDISRFNTETINNNSSHSNSISENMHFNRRGSVNNPTLLRIGEASCMPVMLCGLLQKELLVQQQLKIQQQLIQLSKMSPESSGFLNNFRTSSSYFFVICFVY